jgi:membrane protein DedA with SNARE-associated domain
VFVSKGPLHNHRVRAIDAGDRFFDRHGPKAVFFARWIALVRFAAAWLAGINKMHWRTFFFYNALGGITWAITFGLVGYFGGKAAANILTEVGIGGVVLLALVVVALLIRGRLREKRELEGVPDESPPEHGSADGAAETALTTAPQPEPTEHAAHEEAGSS